MPQLWQLGVLGVCEHLRTWRISKTIVQNHGVSGLNGTFYKSSSCLNSYFCQWNYVCDIESTFHIIILYLKYEKKPTVTVIQILENKANRGFMALYYIFLEGDRVSDFPEVLGLFLNPKGEFMDHSS